MGAVAASPSFSPASTNEAANEATNEGGVTKGKTQQFGKTGALGDVAMANTGATHEAGGASKGLDATGGTHASHQTAGAHSTKEFLGFFKMRTRCAPEPKPLNSKPEMQIPAP